MPFNIAHVIKIAYSQSVIVINIQSGFYKYGQWGCKIGMTSVEALINIPSFQSEEGALPCIFDVGRHFDNRVRNLLNDVSVNSRDTVRVRIRNEAHLTSEVLL